MTNINEIALKTFGRDFFLLFVLSFGHHSNGVSDFIFQFWLFVYSKVSFKSFSGNKISKKSSKRPLPNHIHFSGVSVQTQQNTIQQNIPIQLNDSLKFFVTVCAQWSEWEYACAMCIVWKYTNPVLLWMVKLHFANATVNVNEEIKKKSERDKRDQKTRKGKDDKRDHFSSYKLNEWNWG